MNAPYQSKALTIFEALEELEANDRTRSAACNELGHMIRDGAVTLFDLHRPTETREWLIEAGVTLIDAFRLNSRTVPAGFGEYFMRIYLDRAQFEAAAGIQRDLEGPAALNAGKSAMAARPLSANQRALRDAIKECFPHGVPKDVDMPNGAVSKTLAAWLKAHRPAVAKMSDKTILRAAGRAR